jgi:hypothetical protein
MAQMLNLRGFGGGRKHMPPSLPPERPSFYLSSVGRADAPEPPLVVEFVGITEAQQRAAIGAFPGGKRFVLAAPQMPGGLLRQS